MKSPASSLQPMGYASPWLRLLAFFIDYLIFIPINIVADYNHTTWKIFSITIALSTLWVVYKTVMEWKFGATIGKMLTRIRVVDERMQFPSFNQAMMRFTPYFAVSLSFLLLQLDLFSIPEFQDAHTPEELLKLYATLPGQTIFIAVTFFFVSISSTFIDPKGQALHDKYSQTYCIKVFPNNKVAPIEKQFENADSDDFTNLT